MKKFVVSVDLGQLNDYTAITILEEVIVRRPNPTIHDLLIGNEGEVEFERHYHLRHIDRPPLRTPYTDQIKLVKDVVDSPALQNNCELVIDVTGVGRPIFDMMRLAGLKPIPITITNGKSITMDEDGGYHVPKRDLAMSLQAIFGSRRVKVASGMPLAPVFLREMETFAIKVTKAGNDSYEAWREQEHDDIVMSVAMGVWWVLYSRASRVHLDRIREEEKREEYDPRAYLDSNDGRGR